MKLADFIILAVVIAAAVLSVIYIVKQKKKGKCVGCGGCCENCAAGCKKK